MLSLILLLTLFGPSEHASRHLNQTQQPSTKCPAVSVTAPDGKEMLRDIWRFTVVVTGAESKADLSFVWTVEGAKIKDGQGTRTITIERPDLQKGVIVVVEVGGLPQECPSKATVAIIS